MTANIIEESMYAHFDVDWNEYLLLDTFLDQKEWFSSQCRGPRDSHKRGEKSLESQQLVGIMVVSGRMAHIMVSNLK